MYTYIWLYLRSHTSKVPADKGVRFSSSSQPSLGVTLLFHRFSRTMHGKAPQKDPASKRTTFTNSWSVLAPASSLARAKHLKRIFPSPISLVATISLHTVVTATVWQWTKIQAKRKMVMFAQLQPPPAPGYCRLWSLLWRWLPWTPGPLPCYPHKWPT